MDELFDYFCIVEVGKIWYEDYVNDDDGKIVAVEQFDKDCEYVTRIRLPLCVDKKFRFDFVNAYIRGNTKNYRLKQIISFTEYINICKSDTTRYTNIKYKKYFKMDIEKLQKLGIKDKTGGSLGKQLEYAKFIKDDSLQKCIDSLAVFTKQGEEKDREVAIYVDFAPRSFLFVNKQDDKFVSNGGIIWHGHHDAGGCGGAPTFSVSIEPVNGWQIHT